eukprot:3384515-Amphidinium_carterae.1
MQSAAGTKISKRHTYKLLCAWHKCKEVEFMHKPAERPKGVHGRPLKQRDAPVGSRHQLSGRSIKQQLHEVINPTMNDPVHELVRTHQNVWAV